MLSPRSPVAARGRRMGALGGGVGEGTEGEEGPAA